MQRYLITRIVLLIPTIWLVISILFLCLRALPGDAVTRKLANFENRGAETSSDPIIGEVDVTDTTYRVLADDTLDEIALRHEISVQQLLANNPRVDASEPLRPGLRLVILPGQYLEQLAVRNQVVRAEDAVEGAVLLAQRNPGLNFPEFNGKAYAEKGVTLILRESTTVEEIAYINRIDPDVIMGVNPSGRHTNPDGALTPTSPLYPGDEIILPKTEISIASARHRLGIDKPLGVQYYEFLWDTIRLKFQNSFVSEENSLDIFLRALPQTLHLTVYSLIITLLVGIPIGVISAIRQDSWMDFGLRSFAILALAAPPFWTATMLIFLVTPGGVFDGGVFDIPLASVEARNIFDDFWGAVALYSLPAIAGGLAAGAGLMRITRSEMLEVIRQDYIRTAQAKGLRERIVIMHHALRPAFVNVISVFGLTLAAVVGGNIVLEVLFNIPGIGLLLYLRLLAGDIPVVQTMVVFFAIFVLLVNIVIDLSYPVIDPRVRLA